mmetsp:Transcript_103611/g.231347  ORF Transcript_103611/g.231347 Transcript_103611/m.231347 type:complete len:284 (-) Transcript_103611:27-878(-)
MSHAQLQLPRHHARSKGRASAQRSTRCAIRPVRAPLDALIGRAATVLVRSRQAPGRLVREGVPVLAAVPQVGLDTLPDLPVVLADRSRRVVEVDHFGVVAGVVFRDRLDGGGKVHFVLLVDTGSRRRPSILLVLLLRESAAGRSIELLLLELFPLLRCSGPQVEAVPVIGARSAHVGKADKEAQGHAEEEAEGAALRTCLTGRRISLEAADLLPSTCPKGRGWGPSGALAWCRLREEQATSTERAPKAHHHQRRAARPPGRHGPGTRYWQWWAAGKREPAPVP